MSEKRMYFLIIILIIAAVVVITAFYAVRYIPLFDIDMITVDGMTDIPQSVSVLLASCYGVNRFTLDEGAIKTQIESNPRIRECDIRSSSFNNMEETLVESDEECMLFDGTHYYLISDDDKPVLLEQSDCEALAGQLCVVEVSSSFINYLESFSVPSSFRQILELISEVRAENSSLITHIKYDNNTGEGFGQIVLSLDSLYSELYVREQVSKSRISDSIRVIQASTAEDPAGMIRFMPQHWDLYSDALVKRTVE